MVPSDSMPPVEGGAKRGKAASGKAKKDEAKKDEAKKGAAKKAPARKKRGARKASHEDGVILPTREGVTWFGAPWLVEFRGDTVTVHDLSDGPREVAFTAQDLDAGDDLLLVTDLYVPELTEKERTSDDAYQRACRKLKARVEGELIRRGGASLHWASHSGTEDRDWLVYWSLSGAETKTGHRTPPGAYPMTLTLGEQTVARFVVHWS